MNHLLYFILWEEHCDIQQHFEKGTERCEGLETAPKPQLHCLLAETHRIVLPRLDH